MYFINYITEYIRPIAKKDSWQIREDNKDATWSHVNNNPGISRANTNPGNFEPGGYFWGNNDTTICVFEFEIDSLAPTHKGYYAAIAIKLRYGFEADSAWTCTLRAIPRPETLRRVDKYPLFRWNKPPYDTSTTASKLSFNPILGYSIWRSPNATGPWTRLPPKPDGGGYQPYDTTRYKDT
ncbi:MAG: hypothetical protein ABIL05_01630, partial [candidate division WOR-3 bacterium]